MRSSARPRAAVTLACFQMEERKKKQQQPVRTDYWLQPNIVVKVVTKKLGERYHKRKAVVMVTTSVETIFSSSAFTLKSERCFNGAKESGIITEMTKEVALRFKDLEIGLVCFRCRK